MEKVYNYLQLHFLILLSSFIPSVAILIKMSSVEIVFYRTFMASAILFVYLYFQKKNIKLKRNDVLMLMGSGLITSIYWTFFVISAKISNSSVSLVGLATTPLWVSIINPFFNKGTKLNLIQIMTAFTTIFGVYIIFNSGFSYGKGMLMAIIGAMFGSVLTILNGKFSRSYDQTVLTFYQMTGAFIGTLAFIPVFNTYFPEMKVDMGGEVKDFLLVFGLSVVFSIYVYTALIKIMRTVSGFTVSLVANLSPIYGIFGAFLIFGKSEIMTFYFYTGTLIILISVTAYPIMGIIKAKLEKHELKF